MKKSLILAWLLSSVTLTAFGFPYFFHRVEFDPEEERQWELREARNITHLIPILKVPENFRDMSGYDRISDIRIGARPDWSKVIGRLIVDGFSLHQAKAFADKHPEITYFIRIKGPDVLRWKVGREVVLISQDDTIFFSGEPIWGKGSGTADVYIKQNQEAKPSSSRKLHRIEVPYDEGDLPGYERLANVCQHPDADWSNVVGMAEKIDLDQAKAIADHHPEITYFFRATHYGLVLEAEDGYHRDFTRGDTVFFSGEPTWHNEPHQLADAYIKQKSSNRRYPASG